MGARPTVEQRRYRTSFAPTVRPASTTSPASDAAQVITAAPGAGSAVEWAHGYRVKLRLTDTIVVVGTVGITSALVSTAIQLPTGRLGLVSAGIAAVWLLALCLGKTRDPRLMGVGAGEYKKVVNASAGAFGWLAVIFLINQAQGFAVLFLLTMPAGTVALLSGRWAWRFWLTRQREQGHYLSRVLVIGRYEDVDYVVDQIEKKSGAVYEVVGAALEDPEVAIDQSIGRSRIPLVSSLDDVPEAVKNYGADAVVVAGQLSRGSQYLRELGWQLEESSVELVVALALTNVAGPRVQMRPVEGLPLMHVDLPQFEGYRHVLKRVVDIAVSGCALLVLLPVFAVLAAVIRRDSPGPAFFCQERICRDGRTFRMFKLRSMVETAEEELEQLLTLNEGSGPLFKMHNDPRITNAGVWLRRYSLDELPQFINVFKGQMSLVGPRPPLPSEVAGYEGATRRRLYIKPGLTGLWQINGRSNLTWEESVRLDLYYVENWSLTGDVMIMWRTLKVMVRPSGAY
ncbi:exopolysaccharide biosynthesis polyprenyl glycosylphosphotransferase [Arthrobacter sp. CAN_A6]